MNSPLFKPLLLALAFAPQAFANFTQEDSAKATSYCQGGPFTSTTVFDKSPDKARTKAKAEIASNIASHIKSKTKTTDYSEEVDGVLREGGKFEAANTIESDLTLQGFKEIGDPKKQKNGEYELKVYICGRDAAKGFLQKLKLVSDSLDIAASTSLSTKNIKHKNEAWKRTQMLWREYIGIRGIIEVLGIENPYPAEEIYSKAKANYKSYCQSALHWKPDKENPYSKIAFSKLSGGGLKMETSPCAGKGILLAYKGLEPECSFLFGVNTCLYDPSISVQACDGTEYLQLKNQAKGIHQKSGSALDKLQEDLKSAQFWNQWIQEIKQWRPQCE